MSVRVDPASSNRDITVPRPVSRQKSYKSLLGRASTSKDTSSGFSTYSYINNRIDEEEGEESDMVLGGPSNARAATSQSRSNGNNWFSGGNEYDSDKEDDDDVSQEPVASEIGPQLPGLYDVGYNHDDDLPSPGIIVRVISPSDDDSQIVAGTDQASTSQDNQLLIELRVREYRGNFDGFAEINRFETIDEMHEFIVNNTESSLTNESSPKQEKYLDILLNERDEDRFKRLVDISKGTVRRVLARNEHILQKLYATASLESFPSPLKASMDEEEDEEEEDENEPDEKIVALVEENMKRWYMIEMIGIWLKFITDVKSYREAIKKSVLKANCGIENDRYEGIAVPLKYK